jgi:hypothetical protein
MQMKSNDNSKKKYKIDKLTNQMKVMMKMLNDLK